MMNLGPSPSSTCRASPHFPTLQKFMILYVHIGWLRSVITDLDTSSHHVTWADWTPTSLRICFWIRPVLFSETQSAIPTLPLSHFSIAEVSLWKTLRNTQLKTQAKVMTSDFTFFQHHSLHLHLDSMEQLADDFLITTRGDLEARRYTLVSVYLTPFNHYSKIVTNLSVTSDYLLLFHLHLMDQLCSWLTNSSDACPGGWFMG